MLWKFVKNYKTFRTFSLYVFFFTFMVKWHANVWSYEFWSSVTFMCNSYLWCIVAEVEQLYGIKTLCDSIWGIWHGLSNVGGLHPPSRAEVLSWQTLYQSQSQSWIFTSHSTARVILGPALNIGHSWESNPHRGDRLWLDRFSLHLTCYNYLVIKASKLTI